MCLRLKEIEKKEAEQAKKTKQLEREQNRKEKEKEKREKEERKKAKAIERKGRSRKQLQTVEDLFVGMQISDEESSDDDAVCPKCGLMYSADSAVWICCDGCDSWYDLECTNIQSRRNSRDTFYWENCV